MLRTEFKLIGASRKDSIEDEARDITKVRKRNGTVVDTAHRSPTTSVRNASLKLMKGGGCGAISTGCGTGM